MMTVFWQPGEAHGLVWDQGLALVSGEIDVARATNLWSRCREGVSMGQFLEALAQISGSGLLSLPSFVVALNNGPAVHVAARGAMVIEINTASGAEQIDGALVTTWLERQVMGVDGVELRSEAAAVAPSRPLEAGLVPACALRRGVEVGVLAPPELVSEVHEVPVVPRGTTGASERSFRLPDVPSTVTEVPQGHEVDVDQPRLDPTPVTAGGELVPPIDPPSLEVSDATAVPPPPAPVAPETAIWAVQQPLADESSLSQTAVAGDQPAVTAEPEPGRPGVSSEFEMLWGETSAVDIDQAASNLPNPDGQAPKQEPVSNPAPVLPPRLSLNEINDHDSMTIISLDSNTGSPVSAASDQPVNAGSVVAILCPLGHANPPHRPGCRICGSPLLGEPQRVPRPPLGWMRTSEGERVDLTTPVVIGRKPTVTRLHGLEMPRLVAVPHGHVSSNHLEIRLEGWNVMAVDLHSRNGTLLRRTGEPPVRLPEQPAMLVTGDVVDLGHGVQFSFHELP